MPGQTRGQEVLERLRADLNGEEFKPGDRIPTERELMVRYSAGRNTVREAVQSLVALGRLEVKAGYGTTVTGSDGRAALAQSLGEVEMDEHALKDMVHFRLLFEGETASLAAQIATDAELAEVRKSLADYQDAVRRNEDVFDKDVAFHRAIAAASHNSIYTQAVDLGFPALREWIGDSEREPSDLAAAAAEHSLVVHYIAVGDADAARDAMRLHIRMSIDRREHNRRNLETDGSSV
ncbi:MAG: nanR [Microbacteriaceae bacterium]|jgi:GntR family transcriptional repressor for pyruvate dehydrogenase complex|nr:nanR [Microbacteriaceae bacterium]